MEKKLINLFVATFADLDKLETVERDGLAATVAFEASSKNLLATILKTKTWVFAEDRKVYDEVKGAILAYAKSVGETPEIPGSIAGGKFRAEARKSDDRFIRLAGRLAGRLSTLVSNAKKAAAEKANKGKTTGKSKNKADKGDKVGKAWEEGYRAGVADMGVTILAAISAKKSLKEIAEAIMANTTVEERDAAAVRIKEMVAAKKKAA